MEFRASSTLRGAGRLRCFGEVGFHGGASLSLARLIVEDDLVLSGPFTSTAGEILFDGPACEMKLSGSVFTPSIFSATVAQASSVTLDAAWQTVVFEDLLKVGAQSSLLLQVGNDVVVHGRLSLQGATTGSVIGRASILGVGAGGYSLRATGTVSGSHYLVERPGPNGLELTGVSFANAPFDMRDGIFSRPSAQAGSTLLTLELGSPETQGPSRSGEAALPFRDAAEGAPEALRPAPGSRGAADRSGAFAPGLPRDARRVAGRAPL